MQIKIFRCEKEKEKDFKKKVERSKKRINIIEKYAYATKNDCSI